MIDYDMKGSDVERPKGTSWNTPKLETGEGHSPIEYR